MSKTVQYLIFYGIFCLVMLGMHAYVYVRLKKLFGFSFSRQHLLYTGLLALLFPLSTVCEKFFTNTLSMLLYAAASTWLGIAFMLFGILVLYEPVRLLFKTDSRIVGRLIVLSVAALAVYGLINARFIRVRTLSVPLDGLAQPVRIVQLSDIHVGTIHNAGYLERIVKKTNEQNPDIVCITGDMFDGIGPVTRHTVEPLKQLRAETFFVGGNHEKYAGPAAVAEILAGTSVRVLRNEVLRTHGIQLAGVDYPERENRKTNPEVRQLPIDPELPCVLLYHSPAGLEDARAAGVDLQLSGHTHAGQLFPFNLLTMLFYPRLSGLYLVDGLYLHVSPGTGTWGPPMRVGSNSEITVLDVTPAG